MSRKPRIKPYREPGGGWGAAIATGKVLLEQKVLFKGAAALYRMNKPGGFKCPSCAWPDPKPENADPIVICENGTKALAWELTAKRATPEFFAQHSVTELSGQSDYWLEQQGRITHPLWYDADSDHYVAIEWDKALTIIGKELRALSDPRQVGVLYLRPVEQRSCIPLPTVRERVWREQLPGLLQLLSRTHQPGAASSDRSRQGYLHARRLQLRRSDFRYRSKPRNQQPSHDDRAAQCGAPWRPDPRTESLAGEGARAFSATARVLEMATMSSTPIATHYYQVKIGGDTAALKGIMKAAIDADDRALREDQPRVLDIEFIQGHTAGFEALCADLRATPWPAIEKQSGLARAQLEEAAQVYLKAKNVMACFGMGITQHFRGTQNVQQIVNLLLLRGNIGRPGAGIVPVRGHSNVQGDRTVGITEKPGKEFLDQSAEGLRLQSAARARARRRACYRCDDARRGQGLYRSGRQLRSSGTRYSLDL